MGVNMKQFTISFFVLLLLFFILSCSDDSDILSPISESKFKAIAYKSLSDIQKESNTHEWQDSYVEQGNYKTEKYSPHFIVINSKLSFSLIGKNTQININQNLVAVFLTIKT